MYVRTTNLLIPIVIRNNCHSSDMNISL